MSVFRKMSPYFRFTPNEQKGIIVLLVLLVFIILARVITPYIAIIGSKNATNIEVIQLLEEKEKKQKNDWKLSNEVKSSTVIFVDTSILVNPNKASLNDLLKIGLSEFSASNLIKYRSKGAQFYNIEDMMEVYGIDKAHIVSIQKNLIFDQKKEEVFSVRHTKQLIKINQSDFESLCQIPCVGPVLSKRIIKYRSVLGGYYSLDQIKEVYGIDSTCFKNIYEYIELDSINLNQLNINTLGAKELARHPYVSFYQAKAIVKYRELIGPFERLEQLEENYIFTRNELQKLAFYLSCGHE